MSRLECAQNGNGPNFGRWKFKGLKLLLVMLIANIPYCFISPTFNIDNTKNLIIILELLLKYSKWMWTWNQTI
jgi:hypothetical protein